MVTKGNITAVKDQCTHVTVHGLQVKESNKHHGQGPAVNDHQGKPCPYIFLLFLVEMISVNLAPHIYYMYIHIYIYARTSYCQPVVRLPKKGLESYYIYFLSLLLVG